MKTLNRTGISVVLLAFCCLMVAGILGNYSYAHISAGLQTYAWPKTTGTLLEARVYKESVPGGDADTGYQFTSDVRYSYGVENNDKEIDYFYATSFDVSELRFPFVIGDTDLTKKAPGMYSIMKLIRKDAPAVSVYYNPENPSESVLWQGSSTRAFLIHAYCLAFLFSAYTLFSYYREKDGGGTSDTSLQGLPRFLVFLGLHLIAASVTVLVFYLLASKLTSIMKVEGWIAAYTLLLVLTMLPIVLAAIQIPYFQHGLIQICSFVWLVILAALFFGFAESFQTSEDPYLESYDLGASAYIEWLKGEDPYAIRTAAYTLARMHNPPREMIDPLLSHLQHANDSARKAVVFALSKVLPLREEQYQRIRASLFDSDEKITFSKLSLLGDDFGLSGKDLEVIMVKLLASGEDLKMGAFRLLRGKRDVSEVLQAHIYKAMDELQPGPAYAAGINLYASYHEPSEKIEPLLLKGLRGDSKASSLSCMHYLVQFPEVLKGSFAQEVQSELERIRDSSYGNRKEIAVLLLKKI